MNIFRVHFTWKEKEYELKARSLDTVSYTHLRAHET